MPILDDNVPMPERAPRGQYTDMLDAMRPGQSFEIPPDWKTSSLKSAMLSRFPKKFRRKGMRVWRVS